PAEAERYVRRDAPVEVRLLAASGALPLPPVELLTVLFVLAHDAEAAVKDRARRSIERLPDSVTGAALAGPAHPPLLSYCAQTFPDPPERLPTIALNAPAAPAAIALPARLPPQRLP